MIGLVGLERAARDLDWTCWEYLISRDLEGAMLVSSVVCRVACALDVQPCGLSLAASCSPLQDKGVYSGALLAYGTKHMGTPQNSESKRIF